MSTMDLGLEALIPEDKGSGGWIGAALTFAAVAVGIAARPMVAFEGERPHAETIPELERRVYGLASSLGSWNLKYDPFPDVEEWLEQHWWAPYGVDHARRLLRTAMDERSKNYWGLQRMVRDYDESREAQRAFRAVVADLRGDEQTWQDVP
jgi:hypothetical protein